MTVRVVRRARVAERYMQQVNTTRSEDLMVVRNARRWQRCSRLRCVFETDSPQKDRETKRTPTAPYLLPFLLVAIDVRWIKAESGASYGPHHGGYK